MALLAAKVPKTAAVGTQPLRAKKAIGATAAAWSATLLLVAFSSSASLYLPLAALRLRRPFSFHSRKVFEQRTRIHQNLRFCSSSDTFVHFAKAKTDLLLLKAR
ncbi:MAG: hypothetical protein IJN27_01500 [Oscillospiraceae bacterium]|nr:hypothetical protein [Oscillospiraceae bacterium]